MDQQINCQKGGGCGGSREEVFIRVPDIQYLKTTTGDSV